jgi:hypothetical protein
MEAIRGRPHAFALGVWLASRGGLSAASFVLAGAAALASLGAAIAIRGGRGAIELPTLASSAVAWSVGVTLAFGSALRAIERDRDQGVLDLAHARGVGATAYVRGRVAGLVAVLAMTVGSVALVAGLAATAEARPALASLRTAAGALAYALAFAATMGPLAMAALGARTRARGYFTLLALLALPELLSPWTADLLPPGWHELTSIPAALAAVRAGVASPSAAGVPMARAIAGLAAIAIASLIVVRARMSDGDWRGRG